MLQLCWWLKKMKTNNSYVWNTWCSQGLWFVSITSILSLSYTYIFSFLTQEQCSMSYGYMFREKQWKTDLLKTQMYGVFWSRSGNLRVCIKVKYVTVHPKNFLLGLEIAWNHIQLDAQVGYMGARGKWTLYSYSKARSAKLRFIHLVPYET